MTAALLVRMSSLGDIVHTFPAVTDLKRLRPEVQLDWVVEEQYLDLARMHPGVDRLIPVALRRWRHGGEGAWDEAMQARRTLKETAYDAVVDSHVLAGKDLWIRVDNEAWRAAADVARRAPRPATTAAITTAAISAEITSGPGRRTLRFAMSVPDLQNGDQIEPVEPAANE